MTPVPSFGTVLGAHPVMAILRGFGPARTLDLIHAAWSAGITCIEVPLQNDNDAKALAAAAQFAAEEGKLVGAGTILSVGDVDRARKLGAAFTVSPGFDPEVAQASLSLGMPHLPGVATATEVHSALRFGLDWLKAFPAKELGPSWITAIRAPFPGINIVATGGISADNAQEFLRSGASAVAVGSALEDPAQLAQLSHLRANRTNAER